MDNNKVISNFVIFSHNNNDNDVNFVNCSYDCNINFLKVALIKIISSSAVIIAIIVSIKILFKMLKI